MNDYEVFLRLKTDRDQLARKMRDAQFVEEARHGIEKAQPGRLRFQSAFAPFQRLPVQFDAVSRAVPTHQLVLVDHAEDHRAALGFVVEHLAQRILQALAAFSVAALPHRHQHIIDRLLDVDDQLVGVAQIDEAARDDLRLADQLAASRHRR